MIKNVFNFSKREVVTGPSVSVTERTVHVAGAIDFDDSYTSVLLVFGAKPTIVGATMDYFC
jgi:hypothetical protein